MLIVKSAGLAVTVAVALSACTGGTQQTPDDQQQQTQVVPQSGVVESQTQIASAPSTDRGTGEQLPAQPSLLEHRIIYFEYDSAEVGIVDLSVVEAHARYLLDNPGITVLLEGHADERGSNEYNIALGEQRALSVAKIMQLLGVQNGQLRTVSYGEERPQDAGSNEASWAQNRRVELRY